MTDDERKQIAMNARMEGKSVVAHNIGRKVKVSEMELIAICNFAELGMHAVATKLSEGVGEQAEENMDRHIEAIRTKFANNAEGDNGLVVLFECVAAILRQPRLGRYILEPTT